MDGIPLWYYHDYGIEGFTTLSLLTPRSTNDGTLGDGRCGAWATFMSDVLRAQGITTHRVMGIAPDPLVITPAPEGFLINSWTFNGAGVSDAAIERTPGSELDALVAAYPYLNVARANGDIINDSRNGYEFRFADVTDNNGFAGKGINWNPASAFTNHGFVEYSTGSETVWWDPSYAQIYQGATEIERELNFEDGGPNDPAMVAGYWVIIGADVRESVIGVDLNGDSDTNDTCGSYVMLIRPNAPGVREVVAQGA